MKYSEFSLFSDAVLPENHINIVIYNSVKKTCTQTTEIIIYGKIFNLPHCTETCIHLSQTHTHDTTAHVWAYFHIIIKLCFIIIIKRYMLIMDECSLKIDLFFGGEKVLFFYLVQWVEPFLISIWGHQIVK